MKDKSKSWESEFDKKFVEGNYLYHYIDVKVVKAFIEQEIQSARAEGAREFGEKLRKQLPAYFWAYPSSLTGTFTDRDILIDTLLKEYEEKK